MPKGYKLIIKKYISVLKKWFTFMSLLLLIRKKNHRKLRHLGRKMTYLALNKLKNTHSGFVRLCTLCSFAFVHPYSLLQILTLLSFFVLSLPLSMRMHYVYMFLLCLIDQLNCWYMRHSLGFPRFASRRLTVGTRQFSFAVTTAYPTVYVDAALPVISLLWTFTFEIIIRCFTLIITNAVT